jgi:RNA polymerase sigma-70 factor (ECF subfamily)
VPEHPLRYNKKKENPLTGEHSDLFDRLYRENLPKVHRLAFSLAGNAHDAEDITQEAFFRAFRAFDGFRRESSFFTWMYRITVNVANDHLKYRSKLPIHHLTEDLGYSYEDVIDTNPANNPETEILGRQVRIKCMHALTECLQANERKVFCLAITLDLPHKQVAEILDCSIASVKTTLHRAKKRWFGYMENMCQFIKKDNPCNCRQWVRFALSKGMISKDVFVDPAPPFYLQARKDVLGLRTLREFYQDLYPERADEPFAKRIREGIKSKEWAIFS